VATLKEIELKAKHFADARARLAEDVRELQDVVEQAKRAALPTIRQRVRYVKDHQAALRALIDDSPELFVKPRTVTVHGVKVGFQKGRGGLVVADLGKTVKLIRQHFAGKFDVLVKTTHKLVKKAIGNLPADDLKKIAVQIDGTDDVIVIEDTASDVDKLVSALLEEQAEEEVEA
jgi:hypothetical protein